jgi:hypothetical protein
MALGENAETSLRDDLAKGLEEITAREAAAQPDEEHAPAPEAQPNAEAAKPETDRGDGRDAHGRFVKKEGESGQTADEAQATSSKSAEVQSAENAQDKGSPETPATAAPEGDQPPKSWRADEAAVWSKLDPVAKAAILRREADAAKIAGQNDNERMFGREMADIFRPYVPEIQAAGATPQLAVKILLDNHNALRSNDPNVKLSKARELLVSYGIDPSQLIDPNAPQDPHIRALQNEIIQLRSQVNRPAANQQYAPLPPSAEESNIAAEIERFRADPAHPHFEAVHVRMGQLIEAGAASDLETAYNMAVAADPALRSTVAAQAPAANLQKDTAAARRASASVTGSPGPAGNPTPMSLRDELAENARKLGFL